MEMWDKQLSCDSAGQKNVLLQCRIYNCPEVAGGRGHEGERGCNIQIPIWSLGQFLVGVRDIQLHRPYDCLIGM